MQVGFDGVQNHSPSSAGASAWVGYRCGWCGHMVTGARVASFSRSSGDPVDHPTIDYLRCTQCGYGSVRHFGERVTPGSLPSRAVEHLPGNVAALYLEARQAHSVGSYTAAELVSRTILVHVAVDRGRDGKTSFIQAIDYLVAERHVTEAMKPWVDFIRRRGNKAAHELDLTTSEESFGTLSFLCALLENVYQHPGNLAAALGDLENLGAEDDSA